MTVDDIYAARTACQACSKHTVILTCRIPPTSIVLAFSFWGGQDTEGQVAVEAHKAFSDGAVTHTQGSGPRF